MSHFTSWNVPFWTHNTPEAEPLGELSIGAGKDLIQGSCYYFIIAVGQNFKKKFSLIDFLSTKGNITVFTPLKLGGRSHCQVPHEPGVVNGGPFCSRRFS